MAGTSKSNHLSDLVLNLLRGVNITAPSGIWVGLWISDPGDDGAGTEVSGNGYERVKVTFDVTESAGDTGRKIASNIQIDYPVALGDWTSSTEYITHGTLHTAKTVGEQYYSCELPKPRQIFESDQFTLQSGDIVVIED